MNRPNCGSGNAICHNDTIRAFVISTAEFLTGFYRSLRFKNADIFSILCHRARKLTEKAAFNVAVGVLPHLKGEEND